MSEVTKPAYTETQDTKQLIAKQVASCPILIYMKGSPEFPQCGFSARAVQILASYEKEFSYIDVLQNPAVRAELPDFSGWPTFPQIFLQGELLGGCDILAEMHNDGSLKQKMDDASS